MPPGTLRVWATCVIVVELWALVNLMREVPALRLRLEPWDLVGTIAYVLAFALLESALLLLLILFATALPPAGVLRERFATRGSVVALVTAAWAVAIHLWRPVAAWGWQEALLWLALYAGTLAGAVALLRRVGRLEDVFGRFLDGLVVLGLVYAALGMAGLAIVALRNL